MLERTFPCHCVRLLVSVYNTWAYTDWKRKLIHFTHLKIMYRIPLKLWTKYVYSIHNIQFINIESIDSTSKLIKYFKRMYI